MNGFLNLIFYPKIAILGITEMIPELVNFNPEWVADLSQNLQTFQLGKYRPDQYLNNYYIKEVYLSENMCYESKNIHKKLGKSPFLKNMPFHVIIISYNLSLSLSPCIFLLIAFAFFL